MVPIYFFIKDKAQSILAAFFQATQQTFWKAHNVLQKVHDFLSKKKKFTLIFLAIFLMWNRSFDIFNLVNSKYEHT